MAKNMYSRMVIRHLIFLGPQKQPAKVKFSEGMNVVLGPSNSGKSFIGRAINYMLGGEKLEMPAEGRGYETILLGVRIKDKDLTLVRSVFGGDFQVVEGLRESAPLTSEEGELLMWGHKKGKSNTISSYILQELGIHLGTEVIKNKDNHKVAVTIRSFMPWVMPEETKLQEDKSPVETGQRGKVTEERRLFHYMLTGIDDSSLLSAPTKNAKARMRGQVALLKDLIMEKRKGIRDKKTTKEELLSQLSTIENGINEKQALLIDDETFYDRLLEEQSRYTFEKNEQQKLYEDILATKERFSLLKEYYISDRKRLNSTIEASAVFNSLESEENCYFCGAKSEHQSNTSMLYTDVINVQKAAFIEVQKIEQQEKDLDFAIERLELKESQTLERLQGLQSRVNSLSHNISQRVGAIQENRNDFRNFLSKREELRFAVAQKEELEDLTDIEYEITEQLDTSVSEVQDIDQTYLEELSLEIQSHLKGWGYINQERVTFEKEYYDIRISGKHRKDNGKGVRALLHASFSTGLLEYCIKKDKPHPGFLVLDSPLVTFDPKKNNGNSELDVDIKELFFKYLNKQLDVGQTIILENRNCVPDWVDDLATTTIFTLNNSPDERYGFFPLSG